MTDRAVRLLVLCTVAMGLLRSNRLAAEGLPPRALARIGGQQLYHGPGVGCVALSADGKRAASAATYWLAEGDYVADKDQDEYNRIILVWDAVTGDQLRELRVSTNIHGISHLTFSPDGKSLAAACASSDNTFEVAVVAVESGKLLWPMQHFKNDIKSLRFSLNGKHLWIGEKRGPVSAWNASTGKQLRRWRPPPDEPAAGDNKPFSALAGTVSPDGKVIVWEMGYRDVTQGPQGWSLAGLRVHDAATDKFLYRKNAENQQGDMVFSADGKQLGISTWDKVLVWDAATGKSQKTIEERWGFHFTLTPDGRAAVVAVDPDEDSAPAEESNREMKVRYVETGKPAKKLSLGFVADQWVEPLPVSGLPAFSADGKTLLLSVASALRLFDTTTGKERFRPIHVGPVMPRFSLDGRTLITSCFSRSCRWDVSGEQPLLLAEERQKTSEPTLVYSAGDRLSLDISDHRLLLRETATGRVLRRLEGAPVSTDVTDYPVFGEFSPDATKVLFGNNRNYMRKVWVYDVKTGKLLVEIKAENGTGNAAFSPDSRLVALANDDGSVQLYDAVTGKAVHTLRSSKPLPEGEASHAHLSFSPNGDRLIVTVHNYSGDNYLQQPTRVFDLSRGREIFRFYASSRTTRTAAELSCMVCSPDGRLLAVAEKYSGTVRLIELASGTVRAEFSGHRFGVHGLTFSRDGKTLASGGLDHAVFLWDVTGARNPVAKTERDIDLASCWNNLLSADGQRAGAAIADLLRRPETSMAFLQQQLQPEKPPSEKRLTELIADLDADAFPTREAASRELARLGKRAEAGLRHELTERPSLEMRRRIEFLLEKLESDALSPETLRVIRAVEVLEHLNTPASRNWLAALAKGATEARAMREAKAALQRRENRR
ncbi:MAG TPA: hypothetical protein VMG10_30400 [Gemmataceae bacterium]|nr:hypothetical protein [Gemmataceae bacterium]